MPQTGWIDPKGSVVSFEDALTEARDTGTYADLPYEILAGIHKNLTKERPDEISVTQLLGCPRKVHLEAKIDFAETPQSNYPAFRGMIVHGILEETDGATSEERVQREHRGVVISGQPDNLRVVKSSGRTILRDWKSKAEVPKFNYAYTHHQQQVNLYRWLLKLDWRTTDLEVVYVSMSEVKIIPLSRGGTNRYGRANPMQVWTDEEVEAFLDKRLIPLAMQRKYDAPVRYDMVDVEDLWNCNFCPVKQECYKRAAVEAKDQWAAGVDVIRVPPREKPKKGKKT